MPQIKKGFKTHFIKSFEDYLKILETIRSENQDSQLWYRGHEDASYRLIPSALRECYEIKDQFGQDLSPKIVGEDFNNRGRRVGYINVQSMVNEFRSLAEEHFRITPKNELEWHFLAQHYGVPTTLLDWSTDPLVALFFATVNEVDDTKIIGEDVAVQEFHEDPFTDKGAAVFVINPDKINELVSPFIQKDRNPVNFVLDALESYDLLLPYIDGSNTHLTPCCIKSTPIDHRICRQSGNFTIHGSLIHPLDYTQHLQEEIHKIFIPYSSLKNIKETLNLLDINSNSLYGNQSQQDLIAKQIRNESNKRFKEKIEEMVEKFKETITTEGNLV